MSDSAIATSSTTPAKAKTKKNRLSGSFFRFVLTRFLLIIPTVFILVTIVFFVMRATGDPISAALGGRLTPAELQQRIHAAGYDRPLIVQYVDYLGGLLHGDLGTTLTDNQPVISILTHYGAATFELAFLALIVALIVGIGLGRLAARKRDRAADAGIRTFAILCYATPVFFPRPRAEAHLRCLAQHPSSLRPLRPELRNAVHPSGIADWLLHHRRHPARRHERARRRAAPRRAAGRRPRPDRKSVV